MLPSSKEQNTEGQNKKMHQYERPKGRTLNKWKSVIRKQGEMECRQYYWRATGRWCLTRGDTSKAM